MIEIAVVNCFQNYYLWTNYNNSGTYNIYSNTVVNCFQNYYLWTNYNNRLLYFFTTFIVVNCFQNYYLWTNYNNSGTYNIYSNTVVNCFQNYYLWTNYNNALILLSSSALLWIAFRIIIFELTITTMEKRYSCSYRCELLSELLSLN